MGSLLEKYKIVVMDGSNLEVAKKIANIVISVNSHLDGTDIKVYPLDKNHPTMIVIEFTSISVYRDALQVMIEEEYPGLCIFDPIC